MPHRRRSWVWPGRVAFAVILLALIGYLVAVGLERADKVASSVAAVLALVALGAPHLLPSRPAPPPTTAAGTGSVGIGGNNSGAVSTEVSGTAPPPPAVPPGPGVTASGPGSVAVGGDNTAAIRTRVTGPEEGRR
ncbi:hypothetical protein AB0F81_21745 [Actinoplanes sp. NPDC024001]|uniref:hypothetical protein n=1 Tax=Actinoplanes sp. NPDC024001 TaxID=3154598 RepID=UPI0033C56986